MSERLDRRLAQAAGITRTQAQRAIRSGEVSVGGMVVRDPATKVGADDAISWRDVLLAPATPRYLMLHKPAGYVCSHDDAPHPSALRLIDLPDRERLHFAGRLDADSTGLVLLTDDGGWSHRVTSPRHDCAKVYRVTLAEPLMDEAMTRLAEGVMLRGERHPTSPARVEAIGDLEVHLTIHEGKYHQVKRMLAAVGNHVVALHRETVGGIALDPALRSGEWRELTAEEIASV